jgi:hypothetical protein
MIKSEALSRSNSGSGVVSTDRAAYHQAIAKREQDKYIRGLEQRLCKLESAMTLLEKTVKEITT